MRAPSGIPGLQVKKFGSAAPVGIPALVPACGGRYCVQYCIQIRSAVNEGPSVFEGDVVDANGLAMKRLSARRGPGAVAAAAGGLIAAFVWFR